MNLLYAWITYAKMLPHPSDQAKAKYSLYQPLGNFGMPLPKAFTIVISKPALLPQIRDFLRHSVAKLALSAPLRAHCMRERIAVILNPPETVGQMLFTAPKTFRKQIVTERMCSMVAIHEALAGRDMIRIPLNTTVHFEDQNGYRKNQCGGLRSLLQNWQVDATFNPNWKRNPKQSANGQLNSHLHQALPLAIQLVGSGSVFGTFADKDPSVVWLQHPDAAYTRVVRQLLTSEGRWSSFAAHPHNLVQFYRRVSGLMLPRAFRPPRTALGLAHVPYVYPHGKGQVLVHA